MNKIAYNEEGEPITLNIDTESIGSHTPPRMDIDMEKILIHQRAIIGAFTAFGILVAGLLITAVLSVVIHG